MPSLSQPRHHILVCFKIQISLRNLNVNESAFVFCYILAYGRTVHHLIGVKRVEAFTTLGVKIVLPPDTSPTHTGADVLTTLYNADSLITGRSLCSTAYGNLKVFCVSEARQSGEVKRLQMEY
jgi:hypothetical protein